MLTGKVEHANLSVTDPDRSADMFKEMCGWKERWRGKSQKYGWSLHIGNPETGDTYLALYTGDHVTGDYRKGQPLNHVGIVVGDLASAETAVKKAGLKPFGNDDYEPGRRFYFLDWDNIEFEVIAYENSAV